jgi:hypothetical protein
MAKNILIVPSNSISRTSDRIPYINFINNAGSTPIALKVLSGAKITFSSSTQADILVIDPSNLLISVGYTLNVRSYFAINGVQIINGTLNWVGPTTNIAGAQGAQGTAGTTGAQGNVGIAGAQGAASTTTGAQGAQGNTGTTGTQGSIGAQGNTGTAGSQGPTGNTGAQGAKGNTGTTGSQGATGNTGAQGATGNIGTTGSQGATGNTGAQGSTGNTGTAGPQGATGNTGAQGAKGNTGTTGPQGAQGSTGSQGATGNTGVAGSQGAQGTKGPQGATGITGSQGATGTTGSPGPTGATGTAGSPGPTGSQGATGTAGTTGPQGAQGSQGSTGTKGPQGATGNAGGTGPAGPTGATGTKGPQGATGTAGTAGPTGSQGAKGPQGSTGAQGAVGPSSITCYSNTTMWAGTSKCTFTCQYARGTIVYPYQQTSYLNYAANMYRTATNCSNSICDFASWWATATDYNDNTYCQVPNTTCGYSTSTTLCTSYSDIRLKGGIETIENALNKIMQIEAVEYDWNKNLDPGLYEYFEKQKKLHTIGLIAQNVRMIFPEVVRMNLDGYYSIDYKKLNAVLVEGIKQQVVFVDEIDKELDYLELTIN